MTNSKREDPFGDFPLFVAGFICGVSGALICAQKRGSEVRAIFGRHSSQLIDGAMDRGQQIPPTEVARSGDESDDRENAVKSSAGFQDKQPSDLKSSAESFKSESGSGKPKSTVWEKSTTGIPDPKAHPREYNEAMKKYDTPNGNP